MNGGFSSERPLVVYGASGITGRFIIETAIRDDIPVLLAGRGSRALDEFAADRGLPVATASIDSPEELARLCADGAVLLNSAGPFSSTALPLAKACLATGTPYVDVSGDFEVFEQLALLEEQARSSGVPIIVGAGYGVSIGECLAHHLMRRVDRPAQLRLGLDTFVSQRSPGATESTISALEHGGYRIRDGRIVNQPLGRPGWSFRIEGRRHDFATAPLAESWAIWSSTGIPNVATGIRASRVSVVVLRLLGWAVRELGVGSFLARRMVRAESPDNIEGRSIAVAEVWGDGDSRASAMIYTRREGYRVAADLAIAAAKRVIASELTGFHTPASAFGADFIFDIEGIERRDL